MSKVQANDRFYLKAREVRGVTFAPNGQRCETWLPAGLWEVVGDCLLTSGRDAAEMAPAVKLQRIATGKPETWYTGPASLESVEVVREQPGEPHTLEVAPNNPGPFGNSGLRFALVGFVGMLWMHIPFFTAAEAKAYAAERGWKVRN
jgi:hypothetical protein